MVTFWQLDAAYSIIPTTIATVAVLVWFWRKR